MPEMWKLSYNFSFNSVQINSEICEASKFHEWSENFLHFLITGTKDKGTFPVNFS